MGAQADRPREPGRDLRQRREGGRRLQARACTRSRRENIPILTTLRGWKYGFQSPFKAEVYFFNTRLFTDLKWGTRESGDDARRATSA